MCFGRAGPGSGRELRPFASHISSLLPFCRSVFFFLITMAVKMTSNQSSHDIFGQPSEFAPSILPTNGDVCRKEWKLKVDTGYKGVVNQFRFN